MGDKGNGNGILVVKREGKRTFGGYRGIWADNIKMSVEEMDWACADWIYEHQDRTIDELL